MVVAGTVIAIVAWVMSIAVKRAWIKTLLFQGEWERERGRERERKMMDDSRMSNPRRILRHAQCLLSYFLIYLTMWLKQLFKWKGEILINLHILWKFCFCNIVLACYGLQKGQNRFGVDCKSSHSSNSRGFSPILFIIYL